MTNSEKYKDAESRLKAYRLEQDANDCEVSLGGFAAWLDREARNDMLPCPFCGRETSFWGPAGDYRKWWVKCDKCGYAGSRHDTLALAINAHNDLVKMIEKARKPSNLDKLLEVCHKLCPDNKGYEPKCGCCENKKLLDKLCHINDEISEYKHKICGGW